MSHDNISIMLLEIKIRMFIDTMGEVVQDVEKLN